MGMAKYDRLLYILNLLRSRRSLNARRLAEECRVTERSIYRDIISLSEANVPIYYDNGYKLASGNFLPPLNFTLDEYACLMLALESSPLARAGCKAATIGQVKAKVESGLSELTREQKRTSSDIARVDVGMTVPLRSSTRFYADLEAAISDRRCLELDYDSIEHGPTHRTVDPYFIIFRRHAFYFVGYCHLREDFRTFRIDRIRRLAPTKQHFVRAKGITASDYFTGSWELYHGAPVNVVVRFRGRAARVVATSQHHPEEKIELLPDGDLLYRVTVRGTEEIMRWILRFGCDAEVVEPASLRQELGKIGQYLVKTYRRK
jgi:predicted DNA-binding transcriptional regulator YafY